MATSIAVALLALQITAPGIPPATVRHAENVAASIFAQAGVSVSWTSPGDYRIQVMNSQPRNRSADAAGFAQLTPGNSGYVAICYPTIERTANSLEIDPGDLLGAAIAHEIGHLLLGREHSQSGIMLPHFGLREIQMASRGELLFDANQAPIIRTVLAQKR